MEKIIIDPILLNVDYLVQFFGDNEEYGHGCCGPASLSMCADYALGRKPSVDDLCGVLACLGHDPSGNIGTRWDELLKAGKEVFNIEGLTKEIWGIDQIKAELAEGRPLIVGLCAGNLANRVYPFAGGHYVPAIGFDSDHIICLDPASRTNKPQYYSDSDMHEAMIALGPNIPNGVMHGFAKIR